MNLVALVPGVVALAVGMVRGPSRAFLDVYLPALLLLPDYYRAITPGLPDPTPNQAALLPIVALWLAGRGRRAWRLTITDALVVALCATMAYSEYRAKGYADAQNFLFDVLGSWLCPYVAAKALVEPAGLRVAFAMRLVRLMALQALLGLWEMRMVVPLVRRVVDPLFPGQGAWVPTERYGLIRVAGSFGHAILAGIMFACAYRVQRWLEWTGAWRGRVPWLGLSWARLHTLALLAGSVMTLVRGPWLGALAGAALLVVARARRRGIVAAAVLGLLVVVGVPGTIALWSYASVGREGARTVSQETAAYRKELLEAYVTVALERPAWGWGRGQFPQVPGLDSTDNHFLLLALNHGVPTLGAFVALILLTTARLCRFGALRPRDDPSALLAFTLAGTYAVFVASLLTVYHGMQTVQLFFLLTGWADGLLLGRGAPGTAPAAAPAPARPFRFRRVLA